MLPTLTAGRKQQQETSSKETLPLSPCQSFFPDSEECLRKDKHFNKVTSPITRTADPVNPLPDSFGRKDFDLTWKARSSSSATESRSNIFPTPISITHALLLVKRRKCLRLVRSRLLLMLRRTCGLCFRFEVIRGGKLG